MEARRFDAFARAINGLASRRGALAGLVGASLGLIGLAEAEASHRDKRQRRRQRRRAKRLRRRLRRNNPPAQDPGSETCEGADGCFYPRCGNNGDCYCHIDADTSEPFCGGPVRDVLNCGQCNANETCITIAEDCGGGFGCALPCG